MKCVGHLLSATVVSALLLIGGINGGRHICDVCSCSPTRDEPIKVTCNCQESPSKLLLLKEEDEIFLKETSELRISGCSFLSLPNEGFPRATNLKHLSVDSLNYFHLFKGVFPYLETIEIDRVNDLIFGELLLATGKHLRKLTVKRSDIKVIPNLGLHEAKKLSLLEFDGCHVTSIAGGAIFNANNSNAELSVRILNSVVSEISEDGINVIGEEFVIRNSTLENLNARSVTAATRRRFLIAESRFDNVSSDSLHVKSPSLNVSSNEFARLPDTFLSDLHVTVTSSSTHQVVTGDDIIFDDEDEPRVKIDFVGNKIDNIDLSAFFLKLRYRELNFERNRINCDCSPARTAVFKLSTLFPGLSPMANMTAYETIIENNFCSEQKISLSEYGRQFLENNSICAEGGADLSTLNDAPTEMNDVSDEPEPQKNRLAIGDASQINSFIFWPLITLTTTLYSLLKRQ